MIAFGPVPSRRLGLSLGINNIVSQKNCSYSCVYCQIGETHNKTALRRKHFDPDQLFNDVGDHLRKLDKDHRPDFLTFVANGEPTLDINLRVEITQLKQYGIPVAVITNSSLIDHIDVREALMKADWISLKIDTVDENIWRKINRPLPEASLNSILEAIKVFAAEYKGRLNTETMLVDGYNDSVEQAKQTASVISGLNPETAFLSIPIRPPALVNVKAPSEEKLALIWQIFCEAGINTELLTGFEGTDTGFTGNAYDDILNISAVHPIREETMRDLLKKEKAGMEVVNSLISQELIKAVKHNGKTFYLRKYRF